MNVRFIGQRLENVLKDIPALPVAEELWTPGSAGFDVKGAERIFLEFPRTVVAADGHRILIHNKQADNWGKYSLERRAQHLIAYSTSQNAIDPRKAKFLPNIIQTLERAQFILRDPDSQNLAYGARFESRAIQLVFVRPKDQPKGPDATSHDLITQFAFDGGRQKQFPIIWVCPDQT
jgi:hypothetical protein